MSETNLFSSFRTDLADEAYEYMRNKEGYDDDGLEVFEESSHGFELITLKVKTDAASKKIGKVLGNYTTLKLGDLSILDSTSFKDACTAASLKIREYLPCRDGILIVGLGNKEITADSVGYHTLLNTLVTRHIKAEARSLYDSLSLRETSAILPGVLGNTGIEAAHIINGIVSIVKPNAVIVIDALCAGSITRLCNTVQICDSGITPGSGVANHRYTISKETVGVPVISVGIPTVVSTSTIAKELLGECSFPARFNNEYYVTSKDCDSQISAISRITGLAINLAIQETLSFSDIQNLLIK